MREPIRQFFDAQKNEIKNFQCEIRRIGIIPIVKKTAGLMKVIVVLTNGVKSEAPLEMIEELKNALKNSVENLAKTNQKYTNIVLTENYHYLYGFFKEYEKYGLNIDPQKYFQFETEFQRLYEHYRDIYIREIFAYQFPEWVNYYNSFKEVYFNNKKQVKIQANYAPNVFEKNMAKYIKSIPDSIEKIASRVVKHYGLEENLSPILWKEEVKYWINKLEELQKLVSECYGKNMNFLDYIQMIKNFNFADCYYKKKKD